MSGTKRKVSYERVSIEEAWLKGKTIEEKTQDTGYGDSLLVQLARRNFLGVSSSEHLRDLRKLFRVWSRNRARLAEKIGMGLREVLTLLSYEPTSKEAREAKRDVQVRHKLKKRASKRDAFLRRYKTGIFKPGEFCEEVLGWKKENICLWSRSRQARVLKNGKIRILNLRDDLVQCLVEKIGILKMQMTSADDIEKRRLEGEIQKLCLWQSAVRTVKPN